MIRTEFCAENLTYLDAAIQAGAGRIELCDNLAVGGTTPSYGVIRAAVACAHHSHVPVMTMIRPRGGDFCYTSAELDVMCDDIVCACRLGTSGVVFGCTRGDDLDRSATQLLLNVVHEQEEARGYACPVTFHMAFDQIAQSLQFTALDWLAEHHVARILTHGGPEGSAIADNVVHLQDLIAYAAGRIIILPGAGVTWRNAAHLAEELQVNELHGTKIVRLNLA